MINFQGPLVGEFIVPGDKSITHRAVILASLSEGQSIIKEPLLGEDCLRTVQIFRDLGVTIDILDNKMIITSPGVQAFKEPTDALYTGNSGTTTRLLTGLYTGLSFMTVLVGDESIAKRPMGRVIAPLNQLGAHIEGSYNHTRTPIVIHPKSISGATYEMTVKSAQVKSAIMLASLFNDKPITITENVTTRDHTERMLPMFSVPVDVEGGFIKMQPVGIRHIKPTNMTVPGDISSAAFLMVAALITPGSDITLKNVGVNPTRDGIIDVIKSMGGHIEVDRTEDYEPFATIRVTYTKELKPIIIEGDIIPRLIDEIPIIALLLTQASGTSYIKDAEELKIKETNRIDATVEELSKLGFRIEATEDGMIVYQSNPLNNVTVDSRGDHRIGMMLAISNYLMDQAITIQDTACIDISFPGFFNILT